jgi:hypothetical protein
MNIRMYQKIASVIGVLLSLVSMAFTCRLLNSFANSGVESMLYIVFGICIQGGQVVCFVSACVCIWQGKPGRAIPGLAIWTGLFILSLCGTIGFFATGNAERVNMATANDSGYTLMKDRMAQIDSQIETLTAQSKDFQRRGMLTKGVIPTQSRIAELIEKKENLSQEYMSYEATPSSDAMYQMLAKFFNSDVKSVKFYMFVAYAVALDLCSAVLLIYGTGMMGTANNPNTFAQYGTETGGNGGGIGISQGGYAGINAGVSGVSAQGYHQQPRGLASQQDNPVQYGTVQYSGTGNQTEITADLLIAYIDNLFPDKPRPDNSLNGRRAVADMLKIPNKTADQIHNMLKGAGYVTVRGSKTYPNFSKDEMLMAVAGVPENQAVS